MGAAVEGVSGCRAGAFTPGFNAFGNSPALRRVLQAHFGAALTWARERLEEYEKLEAEREASGATLLLGTWWRTGCWKSDEVPGTSS